jgi:hypothetical protein
MRIWNIFCTGVGNDLTPDERSLSERKVYGDALDSQCLATALIEWRTAMVLLKESHAKLKHVGEDGNAAPLPSDIRNTLHYLFYAGCLDHEPMLVKIIMSLVTRPD